MGLALLEASTPAARAEAPSTPALRGLVVEELRRGSTADLAGLKPGDLLTAWERRTSPEERSVSGGLGSPFDLVEVFLEQVPRGDVTLFGQREGAARQWILPGKSPGARHEVKTAPNLPEELAALLRQGRERVAAGDVDAAVAMWKAAADQVRALADQKLALWFSAEAARAWARAERFREADEAYSAAVSPLAEAGPDGNSATAQVLREWGRLLNERRMWDRAAECFSRALALDRRAGAESLSTAASLAELGQNASRGAGEQDAAVLLEQALGLRQRLAPGSSDVAATWAALGFAAASDDDFKTAERYFRKAVEVERQVTPGGLYLAERLGELAFACYSQHHLDCAHDSWLRAMALARDVAPEDLQVAGFLQGLGDVEMERKDWARAEGYLRESLALGERVDPESLNASYLLNDLGVVERHRGEARPSAEHSCRSLALLERFFKRLDRSEDGRLRWGFISAVRYRDCAQSLAEIGQWEQSLETIERGRARAFLNLLSERDLRARGVPDVRRPEWRQLNVDYDKTREQIARLPAKSQHDMGKVLRLEGRLRDLRRQKERLLASSLPLSSLQDPKPLELPEIRRALDPGTALLIYSVGDDNTLLFTVFPEGEGGGSQAYFSLNVGRDELAHEIEGFRHAIQRKLPLKVLRAQGEALYARLLQPVEPLLAKSQRILLVPDGPLHILPFAALVRQGHYLVEWRPLHVAISATVYAELRKARQPAGTPESWKVVAFGDPLYPRVVRGAGLPRDAVLRSAVRRGLPPLPASRQEVNTIATIFPQTQVFLSAAASEDQVKRVGKDARLVHFAVHGLLNERIPQNSALALSLAGTARQGGNDGLLQAWEIVEELHLDADLVTLSACDTALGRDMGSEGLVGLTRAFQVAGARSVLATLWGIADTTTAELMAEFYRALRAGSSKDEALRAAQMAQIRSHDGSHPFFWAAFHLSGDWR